MVLGTCDHYLPVLTSKPGHTRPVLLNVRVLGMLAEIGLPVCERGLGRRVRVFGSRLPAREGRTKQV